MVAWQGFKDVVRCGSLVAVLCSTLVLTSCGSKSEGEEGNEFMKPGENCLSCHGPGGKAASEATFTLAGTIFPSATAQADQGLEGVRIDVIDAADQSISLTSNRVGNFFTEQDVAFPLKSVKVSKDGKEAAMGTKVSQGGCASCHSQPPLNGAPGRLYLSL